jgi:hypothetical protein
VLTDVVEGALEVRLDATPGFTDAAGSRQTRTTGEPILFSINFEE